MNRLSSVLSDAFTSPERSGPSSSSAVTSSDNDLPWSSFVDIVCLEKADYGGTRDEANVMEHNGLQRRADSYLRISLLESGFRSVLSTARG